MDRKKGSISITQEFASYLGLLSGRKEATFVVVKIDVFDLLNIKGFPVKPSDPSKVLVFEDAPNGGRAAVAAGMKCVMVPNERYRQEALKIGVTQVLHSLEEFRPEEFGLPPFD
ncbi:hypothetical protein ANCCEY_04939 [Ancylostoma ceylanicum]|uniref:HAD hydrolase, family IA, variant 3 n=1 Tax=Ancylostoma ceylanicum TaxID=53326 RepID=A0A0D6LVV5_9BILA|nr:hypothetical protein ANCCEY_04939 [Ancylostoma ceylanicum]